LCPGWRFAVIARKGQHQSSVDGAKDRHRVRHRVYHTAKGVTGVNVRLSESTSCAGARVRCSLARANSSPKVRESRNGGMQRRRARSCGGRGGGGRGGRKSDRESLFVSYYRHSRGRPSSARVGLLSRISRQRNIISRKFVMKGISSGISGGTACMNK